MPRQEVHWKRWQVVASFLAIIMLSVVLLLIQDYRTDNAIDSSAKAERTANRAAARATALEAVNRRQDQVRSDLVQIFCAEDNALKERIRATVKVNVARFRNSLTQLGIDPLSRQGLALLDQAREQESEVLERFSPTDCEALPGG